MVAPARVARSAADWQRAYWAATPLGGALGGGGWVEMVERVDWRAREAPVRAEARGVTEGCTGREAIVV